MSLTNPHFNLIERAPYELANLLEKLPPQHAHAKLTSDERLMLHAATDHAANYSETLLDGIEAIGHLLFSASTNEGFPLSQGTAAHIGTLLSALAVQAQYLKHFSAGADSTLARQGGAA
jgi:hypothetical protein